MAADGGRSAPPLDQLLYAEPYRFDFYQAVALLEYARPEAARVGETAEPLREAVWFRGRVSAAFPASEIHAIERPARPDQPTQLTVNFMNLVGALGPLPAPVTEIVQERVRQRDTAFMSFLDMFVHRLVSLMYRARKVNRFWIGARSPADNPFARYLYALIGLGTDGLKGRMDVADRSLLRFAGLLARTPRTQAGLARMINHMFRVQARVAPFRGRWHALGIGQQTALGRPGMGRNNELGGSAVLGSKVWDQTSRFQLRLGPLSLKQFHAMLPPGPFYRPLCDAVRFYGGDEYEPDIRLDLRPSEVPQSRLSSKSGPLLGWTSWLRTKPYELREATVRLSSRRLGAHQGSADARGGVH
ncbi:MAG: type VI secretion system baseplate subunit TssG [Alphaproteobacteria bacterium]|nr:type VI secretion system baseplate subunit TssG [Alphaproteobacteria bacterium]